jgi:tRNA-guanine family transglycosylase
MKRSRSPPNTAKPIQLLLHAPAGVVPYMTPLLMSKYFPAPQPHLLLCVSVQDTCLAPLYPTPEATKPRGYEFVSKSIPEYLQPYDSVMVPSFDLLQDAQQRNQDSVQATNKGVSVWSLQGRQVLTNQAYLGLAAAASSATTTVVSLYDQAASHQSKQRHEQASNRNQEWLQQLLLLPAAPKSIWAAITLKEPVATTLKEPVPTIPQDDKITGYAIVGVEKSSSKKLIQQLDSSKTIAVLSVTSMESVLECLEQGVDVIGTNLPAHWSLSHQALVLPVDYKKKPKTVESTTTVLLIDLTDKKYAKDGAPLVEGCTCLACKNHSRAYIHHLHQAKELLAQILLMGHNLHHFLEFCRHATQARDEGQLDAFVQHCK